MVNMFSSLGILGASARTIGTIVFCDLNGVSAPKARPLEAARSNSVLLHAAAAAAAIAA